MCSSKSQYNSDKEKKAAILNCVYAALEYAMFMLDCYETALYGNEEEASFLANLFASIERKYVDAFNELFAIFYYRVSRKVRERFIMRKENGECNICNQEIDDYTFTATQQTFVHLWYTLPKSYIGKNGYKSIIGLIYVIARRRTDDLIRRLNRRGAPGDTVPIEEYLEEYGDTLVEDGLLQDEVAAWKEKWEILCDHLLEEHKQLLDWRYFQELSYKEIAEILGIDVNTLRARLHQARAKARQILEEHGIRGNHENFNS